MAKKLKRAKQGNTLPDEYQRFKLINRAWRECFSVHISYYLTKKRKPLVDFLENRLAEYPSNTVLSRLVQELATDIPMTNNGKTGDIDKAHVYLAQAMMFALWCGWLSTAKSNRTAYPLLMADVWKESINTAFEIGRHYAYTRK